MAVREYRESDLAALRALHAAQGFGYAFRIHRNNVAPPGLRSNWRTPRASWRALLLG